jgi:hypothetical protein
MFMPNERTIGQVLEYRVRSLGTDLFSESQSSKHLCDFHIEQIATAGAEVRHVT